MPDSPIKTRILEQLDKHAGALVAYSGGVDSTLLATLYHQVYGDTMLAVFAHSPFVSKAASSQAQEVAKAMGFPFLEIEHPGFDTGSPLWNNPPDRCYLCKRSLLEELKRIADAKNFPTLFHGENLDDLEQDRPGSKAAQELGVVAPFVDAWITKAEIRELARELGLPNADAPSDSCLATRLPHNVLITQDRLDHVAATEQRLRNLFPNAAKIRARVI